MSLARVLPWHWSMMRRRPRSNSSWSDHERLHAGAARHRPDPRARPTVGGRPPGPSTRPRAGHGARGGQYRPVVGHDRYGPGVRHGEDDDVADGGVAADGFGGGGAADLGGQRGGLGCVTADDLDVVTRADGSDAQYAGHAAQPDDADLRHGVCFFRCRLRDLSAPGGTQELATVGAAAADSTARRGG